MLDRDTARQQVAAVVERFRKTASKDRESYNEDQTRHYFVLPLFRALGWDTENPAEFSPEEHISRGFVDFGFYLNGVPAFYLETKRAAEKLEKPAHMRQAINYAYLKGVTWAVLTDFARLMVFNAEWETKDPTQARFLDLSWERYSTDQFDDLWLLSKPAMQTREMDTTAERFGKKARKEPVTKTLFKDLAEWRHALFNNIRQMRTTLWSQDSQKVDNAVQKLLDRLIFVRSVEDRGVEPPRLQAVLRQSKPGEMFPNLLRLFRELDGLYNSNLFSQGELDLMELHDPGLLTEIINGLYRAPGGFVDYDFNAISADVLGAVYEQYLGFRAQDPEATQAIDKRKKRKSQGIYYTPQFVVRYIVRQTLGKLLDGGADPFSLRVLDPACGSGSFLIEAFDVLYNHLRRQTPGASSDEQREWRRRILTECLYGVDLDDQAVEVTRLNLMLRAALERGKLPYLTHIQRGNSLIDDPAVAGDLAFKWGERFPTIFQGEIRPLWFVTFVTHNSRVSERMVTYGVKAGEALVFTPDEQIVIAGKIAEACRNNHVPVVAWNVLPDHVHMVIGARDRKELEEFIRKIKGFSSYAFQRAPNWESGHHVWAQKFHSEAITTQDALYAIIEYVRNNHEKHAEWNRSVASSASPTTPAGADSPMLLASASPTTPAGADSPMLLASASPTTPAGADSPMLLAWNKGLKPLVENLCVSPEEAAHIPGGFDVVIGNPPYVRQETLGTAFKEYAQQRFATYAGTADLYVYFIEKGVSLAREGGKFSMIVGNKWMRANYGNSLRQWLKQQPLEEIVDFGDLPVFQDATTYPCILSIARPDKAPPNKGLQPLVQVAQVKKLDFPDLGTYVNEHRYTVDRANLEDSGWSLARSHTQALLAKLRAAGIPLGEYVNRQVYRGVLTGLDKAFVIDETTRIQLIREDPRSAELLKPFLLGRDIKRYETPNEGRYVILIPSGWTRTRGLSPLLDSQTPQSGSFDAETESWKWLKENYPAVTNYLAGWESQARNRWDKGEFWWELRSCDYYDQFKKPKIVYLKFQVAPAFTFDHDDLYANSAVWFMPSDDLLLLGTLNSKFGWFLISNHCTQIQNGYQLIWQYLKNIPIRPINFDNPADKACHDRMVTLVEQMLLLKQQQAALENTLDDRRHELAERIARTDADIDALVYQLYGLTDDEIRLVEGR